MLLHSLLDHRFEPTEQVGVGGMGTVYRARDLQTGQWVALKLLNTDQRQEAELERFARESRLLATLNHPGIVGHVAHGLTADGRPFLAMEWLEGQDLAQRLRRGRLTLAETLTLLEKATTALSVAHQAGMVHRDLKPSNLFLRGGRVADVAILDFGIARYTNSSSSMTRTGSIIGTPDYMAPEQARGDRDVGPTADIFSLGCVVYECLTGQPPFAAEHIAATLAKILFAKPEPLRSTIPTLSPAVEKLVLSMLAKDAIERPANATELLSQLQPLTAEHGDSAAAPDFPIRRTWLAGDEQRLLCVIVVTPRVGLTNANTLAAEEQLQRSADITALRSQLAAYDAQLEPLADGSMVITLGQGHGGATEQVARAVQCAQLLRERTVDTDVVLATGRGVEGSRLPVGEAIDRAGRMLKERHDDASGTISDEILLDEVSASLLRGRYQVECRGTQFTLRGESVTGDPSRPLLGQPTPCIGRESEFGILEGTLSTCIDEMTPRAILITALPGMGKSRLRHEFLRRIALRGLDIQVWIASCDPLSTGTPYGPLGRMFRQLCRIHDDDSLSEKCARLSARIAQHLPPAEAPLTTEFLGELCGVHFPDEHRVKLRAARQDPRVMSDQVTQAFLRFLQAECTLRPLLLILEDLQWCDALTIRIIGYALSQLRDTPLIVLALGRPEVNDKFPSLWQDHVQLVPLRPLSRKASERLVQQLLGTKADPQTMARIIAHADGNPLWLEELIRAAVERRQSKTPETILAMLQARIGQLPAPARRVLRAASVFGETFWLEGVAALLQQDVDAQLRQLVANLVQRELLVACPDSRYATQQELRFRHTLMRDAAYSLLTDEDRSLGHRIAGAFLESQGENESAVLAAHAQRGQEPARAVRYYSRAAEEALAGNDVTAALRHAQAGLSCEPTGEALGLLHTILATANLWGGELRTARASGLQALALLPRGSKRWFQAILAMWLTTTYLGQHELFDSLRDEFRGVTPLPDAIGAYVESASFLIVMTSLVGQAEESRFFLKRLEQETAPFIEKDVAVRGFVKYAQGVYCHWIESDLWLKAELAKETIAAADYIGDRRLRCLALTSLGLAQMGLGAYGDGTATFREALYNVNKLQGETYLLGSTTSFFALGLTDQRDSALLSEAVALAKICLATVSPTSPSAGLAHISQARAFAMRGQYEEALQHSEKGVQILRVEPAVAPLAFAMLARVLLLCNKPELAQQTITEGMRLLDQIGSCCTDVDLLYAATEVAFQRGDTAAVHAALRECVRRLRRSADRIPDPVARRCYLRTVPLHGQIWDCLANCFGKETAHELLPCSDNAGPV